ncbi:hypothetical protein SAMN05421759_11145 [Roseivivax lentus]|uniref:Uncharacterized protein n=1 Tax=Roseivivax lentus TaxID=633194 RepID=A0A1N7NZ69_9RHOB|nr:hypothetical protein [Roseivivax lentus]SIT03509.1 hypothetical protein SAMN05421759_11145 [Roseivivax lentus]
MNNQTDQIFEIKRIQPEAKAEPVKGPLAACDCDDHCEVEVCVVGDDVDVDVCGVYGG